MSQIYTFYLLCPRSYMAKTFNHMHKNEQLHFGLFYAGKL